MVETTMAHVAEPQGPFPTGMWNQNFFSNYDSAYTGPTRTTSWRTRTPTQIEPKRVGVV